jgi:hypothetical protein
MPKKPILQNGIISKKMWKWDRAEILLDQDEEAIKEKFPVQFPNESDAAFIERKKYFIQTFVNITHDLVSAPVNSIFRQSIKANFESETSLLKTFAENVTLGNDPTPYERYIKDFVGIGLRTYGNVITVVDKPRIEVKNRLDERKAGMPYLSNVRPQDVLDWQMQDGSMVWFAYQRNYQPEWLDPIGTTKPDVETLQYIWTRDELIVQTGDGEFVSNLSFKHGWGIVPVVWQASFLAKANDVIGNAAFDQTSNMIITMNNLYNLGVHELYKHGGSLLLMPEDAVSATNFGTDTDGETLLKKQNKGGVLTYGGEIAPNYLVKDLVTEKIMEWASFYKASAVENERDLKSVIKKGMDGGDIAESSIAKVVDREPLEANLVALADDIETYTKKIMGIVAVILKVKNDSNLEIDKDFDIRTLKQKFEEIETADKTGLGMRSPTLKTEMFKNTVGDITRDVKLQQTANKELEESQQVEIDNAEKEASMDDEIRNMALANNKEQFKGMPNESQE